MLYIWGRYLWLFGIALSCVNAVILWRRSRAEVELDPELGPGYTKLLVGNLTWLNIPWVVMGYGIMVGGVPSLWYFFRPQDGDPYVLMWFTSILVLWLLGAIWVFSWGGAEMLARHPAAFSSRGLVLSASNIKLFWVLSLAGGVIGFVFMLLMDFPVASLPLR